MQENEGSKLRERNNQVRQLEQFARTNGGRRHRTASHRADCFSQLDFYIRRVMLNRIKISLCSIVNYSENVQVCPIPRRSWRLEIAKAKQWY